MLFLVRHGRPLVVPGIVPARWELDPEGYDDVWALRESGRLPQRAAWFSSPEPTATATAQLLTDGPVGIVDDLREHVRENADWIEDFHGTVARAFADPDHAAYEGWEPLAACRDRLVAVVRPILAAQTGGGRRTRRPRHCVDRARGSVDRRPTGPGPVGRAGHARRDRARRVQPAGVMFWFPRNTLSGSNSAFTCWRRA